MSTKNVMLYFRKPILMHRRKT